MTAEMKVEDPYVAKSPDRQSKVRTLNGKDNLAELGPVPSTSAFTMTGDGLARYIGTTTCHLTFGDGDAAIDIGPFKVTRVS